MNNERGVVLPLTVALCLIIAFLLLQFAYRIENQTRTYELERHYLTLSLLEKECITFIIEELADSSEDIADKTITLYNGTVASLTYLNGFSTLDITYNFNYHDYSCSGTIEYNKKQQTYLLK